MSQEEENSHEFSTLPTCCLHTRGHMGAPHRPRLHLPTASSATRCFLSHFAPSSYNILQQIKHPLLGMFSICFMLILIKESETEQTVPSRWPYKCEISKLFYLPQTPLVNFFKLIPASESLLIPRRELSNPSLQIFAFVTTPGAKNWRICLCSILSHLASQPCLWPPRWPNPSAQNRAHKDTQHWLHGQNSSRTTDGQGSIQTPPFECLLFIDCLFESRDRDFISSGSLPRGTQQSGLGQVKTRKQQLCPGFPHGKLGPKN